MNDAIRRSAPHSLGYFQCARGLGILFIIAGHSITPFFDKTEALESAALFSGAGSVFGGGVIAMFFMICGFGGGVRGGIGLLRYAALQARLLLRPYAVTAASVIAVKLLLSVLRQRPFSQHGGELIPTFLFGLNAEGGGTWLGMTVDSVSVFWFLLALVGGNLILYILDRCQAVRLRTALTAVCVLLGWGMSVAVRIWPYCLPLMLLAAGYLAAGRYLSRTDALTARLPVWSYAFMAAVTLASFAVGGVNMAAGVWRAGVLDIAATFCVGFFLLRLYAAGMERLCARGGRLMTALETVGLYSMPVLCLHAFEKFVFPWYRLETIVGDGAPLTPAGVLLCAAVCFAGRLALIFGLLWLRRYLPHRRRAGGVL